MNKVKIVYKVNPNTESSVKRLNDIHREGGIGRGGGGGGGAVADDN
jgi:hypothetical protein